MNKTELNFSNACDLFSLRNMSRWQYCGVKDLPYGSKEATWKCRIPTYEWCRYTITFIKSGHIIFNSNCPHFIKSLARV